MDDEIDQIDRLFALRERGLLTDEEFQAEKSKLLQVGVPAPEHSPSPSDQSEDLILDEYQGNTERSYKWLAALAGAALLIGSLYWIANRQMKADQTGLAKDSSLAEEGRSAESDGGLPDDPLSQAIEGDNIEEAEENAPPGIFDDGLTNLDKAFLATIGRTESNFAPQKLVSVGPSTFAVVATADQDDTHSLGGLLSIQYAKLENGAFLPVGRAFTTETGSFGSMSGWEIRENLTSNPLLIAYGGGTWQGCTTNTATLIELTPVRPVEQISFPISYDYDDGAGNREFSATILKGQNGIDVRYTGDVSKVVEYESREANWKQPPNFLTAVSQRSDASIEGQPLLQNLYDPSDHCC